jgi:hypothetical protein
MVKTSGADLITYKLHGGYFTTPRWSKNKRRGKMTGECVNRYTAGDLKKMTAQQVLELIERDLFEDAYERQKTSLIPYKGKDLAESIETVLYLCPKCEKIGTIRSEGNRFFCGCGLDAVYTQTGFLEGEALPFSTITEWDRWQYDKLEEIANNAGDTTICADEGQRLYTFSSAVGSIHAGEGIMSIDRETFRCAGKEFPIDQITRFAVVGQMTLQFAMKDGESYEVRSAVPRSALKYREIFHILTGITTR